MSDHPIPSEKPQFGIGAVVNHPMFGTGRVANYEGNSYVMLFKGGDSKRVAFSYQGVEAVESNGSPEIDFLKHAVEEVLGEHGWLDVELEMGNRWTGGTMTLNPGKDGTQPKEIPIETFFKKIIGVREKLRVLEQKVNNHPSLSGEEKLELDGYISRCYGSLTTFNSLFANRDSHFKGTGRAADTQDE